MVQWLQHFCPLRGTWTLDGINTSAAVSAESILWPFECWQRCFIIQLSSSNIQWTFHNYQLRMDSHILLKHWYCAIEYCIHFVCAPLSICMISFSFFSIRYFTYLCVQYAVILKSCLFVDYHYLGVSFCSKILSMLVIVHAITLQVLKLNLCVQTV